MSENAFNDKNKKPDDGILAEKIGKSFKYLEELKMYIQDKHGVITEEWKYYGKKYGWQQKILLKKRNLFFVIPQESFFRIVFIFGDKAVNEIRKSDIDENLKSAVINARKYTEGRGLSIDVNEEKHISDIKKLVEIKINN